MHGTKARLFSFRLEVLEMWERKERPEGLKVLSVGQAGRQAGRADGEQSAMGTRWQLDGTGGEEGVDSPVRTRSAAIKHCTNQAPEGQFRHLDSLITPVMVKTNH
jgi:hypothetical protein